MRIENSIRNNCVFIFRLPSPGGTDELSQPGHRRQSHSIRFILKSS